MGNSFSSKPKAGKITDVDRAVLTLKTQRKKLNDQRKRLDDSATREVDVARQLVAAGKKDRALLALKRKKLQENQITGIDALLVNVEQVLLDIDAAKRTNRLFDALQSGSHALKQLQAGVSVEAVESLMEESAEAKAHEQAIRRALDQAGEELFGAEDEAAVEAEFAALEAATLEEEAAGDVARLPAAPAVPAPAAAAAAAAGKEREGEGGMEGLPPVPTHEAGAASAAAREGGSGGTQAERAPARVLELAS